MLHRLTTTGLLIAALCMPLASCAGRYRVDPAVTNASTQEPVDFDKPDLRLLSAAIVQVSNSVRAEHGRVEVVDDKRLRIAAERYSQKMVAEGFIAHEDPNTPSLRTPKQRAAAAGIANPLPSENIAALPAFQVTSGEMFYVLDADTPVIAREPDGPPIERHTYATLAAAVVEGWMNSPGHRRNLLDEDALQIGVGAAMYRHNGIPTVVVVQMFQLYEQSRP